MQDTNPLQAMILKRLKPDGRGVTVVGDDAQAIYGFRAADPRNILRFHKQFSPHATIVKLERNYRSTQAILDASNAVINEASDGFGKKMHTKRKGGEKPKLVTVADEQAQTAFVADQIVARREAGRPLNHQAVLFRSSHHSAQLEIELTNRKSPFVKFGGIKFMEAAHIKDVLAVLRWFENPADGISGARVMGLLPGIGHKTAQRLLDAIGTKDIASSMAGLQAGLVPPQAMPLWREFVKLARALTRKDAPWQGQVESVRAWHDPMLEAMFDDAAARRADLDQLQIIAAAYTSRRTFITELTLDPPSKSAIVNNQDTEDDVLTLSTIHSCKGREWHCVTLLNAVDGCVPSSRAEKSAEIEEERRLLYVAMTRAKSDLTIIMPWRVGRDYNAVSRRTRFITDDMLRHFEQKSWRCEDRDADLVGAELDLTIDLKSLVRRAGRR